MKAVIDLRSDTITRPTDAMRQAMATAEVGDDVFGDDPTLNRLEECAAEITGKEAALFVVSGTMGNQIAVNVHTRPRDEVILGFYSHIFTYELGGVGYHSASQTSPIEEQGGMMPLEEIKKRIRKADIHFPRTSLICLENTHNMAGGVVLPLDYMKEVYSLAREHNLSVHLDGARLFNASIASNISVKEYCRCADSVMFCLSKGLAAPVGSLLVGSEEFIKTARKVRKSFGGGIRQGGVLAAAGLVSLGSMVDRLAEDHRRAKVIAEAFSELPGIVSSPSDVHSNIVLVRLEKPSASELVSQLNTRGLWCFAIDSHKIRLVTHNDFTEVKLDKTLQILQDIKKTWEG